MTGNRGIGRIVRQYGPGFGVSGLILFLAACSGQYGAPLEDRSTELEQQRPEIVRGGETVSAGSPVRGADSPTPPAASDGDNANSSGTVVRGVAIGSGISRRRLGGDRLPDNAGDQSDSRQETPSSHIVARGDTLYSIAWMYGLDYRRLAIANDLAPPYTIYPGQQLQLDDRNVSSSAVDALPEIPASPAGSGTAARGERPGVAVEARRTGDIARRSRDGVSWQWPVDGQLAGRFNNDSRGIDIAGTEGEDVYAAADGEVVYSGRGIQGAGNLIILRHSPRHLSAYMHNSTMLVSEGARIRAGDKIAETGRAPDGRNLLHFEIRVDGQPVNPLGFLPPQ